MSKEIIDASKIAQGDTLDKNPAVPKRGRGRPKKNAPEIEAQKKKEAQERLQQERVKHWQTVVSTLLNSVSLAVENKFPGCGPTPQEIEEVSPSAAWLLDYYLPEESPETVHWSNLVMGLLLPTGLRIVYKRKHDAAALESARNGKLPAQTKQEKEAR